MSKQKSTADAIPVRTTNHSPSQSRKKCHDYSEDQRSGDGPLTLQVPVAEAHSVGDEDYAFPYDPGLRQVNSGIWLSKANGTTTQDVFLVHGRDEPAQSSVAAFLKESKLTTIVLENEANHGSATIMEKFLHYSSNVAYAVVLLMADDSSGRPRSNVLIELGFFIGRLGRDHVCILKGPGVEIPSDLQGVLYIEFDSEGTWERGLAREMMRAGLRISR